MKQTPSRLFLSGAMALLLVALFAACQSVPTRTAADLQRLQGYWVGRGPGGECSVTISGNSLRYGQPAADEAREDFWYETTFTLFAATGPKQLHATIIENHWPEQADIGTVVVTIFKIESEKLTLGVVEDFDGSPPDSIVGDWDWVRDTYHLERAQPRENKSAAE